MYMYICILYIYYIYIHIYIYIIYIHIYIYYIYKYIYIDRQINRQIDTQIDRQIDRQNQNKNMLGKKPSVNISTCNCRNKEIKNACPLNGQCKQEKQFTRAPFQVTNQITKKKSILELRKNFSKDAYTTTIYLLEMNFIKTTQNFLRKSCKSK